MTEQTPSPASPVTDGANAVSSGALPVPEPVSPLAVTPVPEFSWGGYFEAIGIMLLLLGLLWLAAWALRRYSKLNFIPRAGSLPRNALFLETQLPLGPKKGLAVVRFLNTRLLLGITEQQITVLKETDFHEQQDDCSATQDFAQVLDDATGHASGASTKKS